MRRSVFSLSLKTKSCSSRLHPVILSKIILFIPIFILAFLVLSSYNCNDDTTVHSSLAFGRSFNIPCSGVAWCSSDRKTTLARELAQQKDALYLDLESERDRAKLVDAELYLSSQRDKLVVLDEIHRVPGLFPVLRGIIDQSRFEGRKMASISCSVQHRSILCARVVRALPAELPIGNSALYGY